jgi:F0F1-type ATP synthase assembly protein I
MAFIGLVVAIIGACIGWFDKTISTAHLFVLAFIVLALICGHLAYRGHQNGGWL